MKNTKYFKKRITSILTVMGLAYVIFGLKTATVSAITPTPTPVISSTITICPSGTAGQGGCNYIGGDGIQQAIDAATPGSSSSRTDIILKSGTYTRTNYNTFSVVDSTGTHYRKTFLDTKQKNLIIEGDSATVQGAILNGAGSSNVNGIAVLGGSVDIKNLKVQGFKKDPDTCFATDTNSSSPCSRGHGIYLGNNAVTVVTNNTISSNQNDGISLDNNSSSTISGNTISSNANEGIELTLNSVGTVTNNQFSNNAGDIALYLSSQGTITNNTFSSSAKSSDSIGLYGSSVGTIMNNQFSNLTIDAIELYNNSQGTISNNIFSSATLSNTYSAVSLTDNSVGTVTNNQFSNNAGDIALYLSSQGTITNNTFSSSATIYSSVALLNNSVATIIQNQFSKNDGDINLFDSSHATISNNTFTSTINHSSIFLGDNSVATINNNKLSNSAWGIGLYGSSQSTILNNIINDNNGNGIFIGDNVVSTITNNVLVRNGAAGVYINCTNGSPTVNGKNDIAAYNRKDPNPNNVPMGYGIGTYACVNDSAKMAKLQFSYILIYGNQNGCASPGICSGTGFISSDPKFVSSTGTPPDFHLQSTSPAIDTGDPAICDGWAKGTGVACTTDATLSRSDIGAYGGSGACGLDPSLPGCPSPTRQDMCQSLTVSKSSMNTTDTVTLNSSVKPSYTADTFSYAFYNLDNLYGPGNPKPFCVTSGGDDISVVSPCPAGSHQLIYWDPNTALRTTGSRSLSYSDIFKFDTSSASQTKNVQINAYFKQGTNPISLPNNACVASIASSVPSPTVTSTPLAQCNDACTSNSFCAASNTSWTCYNGFCRLSSNPTSTICQPVTSSTPIPCPRKSQGDANCDGLVNGIDYSIWLNSQCHPSLGQTCSNYSANFNDDTYVDDTDYGIWLSNRWTSFTPSPTVTAVPPPPPPTIPAASCTCSNSIPISSSCMSGYGASCTGPTTCTCVQITPQP